MRAKENQPAPGSEFLMDKGCPFLGKWIDEMGKVLVINSGGTGFQVDFYQSPTLEPALRQMATGEFIPTLGMSGYLNDEALVVELGTFGLGATQRLRYRTIERKKYLVPEIEHGMYGDYDADFGVPWVFPLSLYTRCEQDEDPNDMLVWPAR